MLQIRGRSLQTARAPPQPLASEPKLTRLQMAIAMYFQMWFYNYDKNMFEIRAMKDPKYDSSAHMPRTSIFSCTRRCNWQI